MQSLEARIADRKKRAAENRKEGEKRGLAPVASDTSDFDVDAFMGGNVGDITGKLSDLSDKDFEAVMDHGDERAGVKSAIEAERKRRESRGNTNWTPNV